MCIDDWGGHTLFLHRQLHTAKASRASEFPRHHLGKSHTDHVLGNQRAMLVDVPLASESNILIEVGSQTFGRYSSTVGSTYVSSMLA
jgi:hypothetical protein